jgi:hypothetical protein
MHDVLCTLHMCAGNRLGLTARCAGRKCLLLLCLPICTYVCGVVSRVAGSSWARVLLLGSYVFLYVECLSAFCCALSGLCMVAVMEHTNGMWAAACVLRYAAGGIIMVEWQNAS